MIPEANNYWTSIERRVSRRGLLRAAGIGGAGLAGAALIGCGADDDAPVTPGAPGASPAGPGTTPAPSDQPARQGGTLRMHGQDPIGFDPHANFSFRTHQNQSFFMEGLFEVPVGVDAFESDFSAVPNIASDYEQVDDITFVVDLRSDVHFQDKAPVNGRAVVAEDVKYSYERMVDKRFTYRDLIEGVVANMEVVDDHTMRFTLEAPYADFLGNLANHYNWVVARELDETHGDMASPEAAIGAGPWILDSYEPNVRVNYSANPNYFRGRPNADRVEFLVLPEAAPRESMLRAGDLDLVSIAALARQSIAQTNPDVQWWDYYSNGGDIFYYNAGPGDFAEDARVRQAINLSLDREAWLDAFYLGSGSIYNGPPVLAAYEDWQVPLDQLGDGARWWQYDPTESRQLLDAAGFDFSRTYKVDGTAGYGAPFVDRQQLMMDFLNEIGIRTEANMKEYGDWLATGHAGVYEDFAFGPMTPQLSIDAWVWGLFHSSSGVNKAHIQDPMIDELVDRTRTIYGVEARKEAVAEASRYIADQAVYVYPPVGLVNYAVQPWVKDFRPKGGYFHGKTTRLAWVDR
jgi:peptide/nickel transport system substrate-binding protein